MPPAAQRDAELVSTAEREYKHYSADRPPKIIEVEKRFILWSDVSLAMFVLHNLAPHSWRDWAGLALSNSIAFVAIEQSGRPARRSGEFASSWAAYSG